MTELIWDGKYKDGKKQGPVRIALPFQTIETVNESTQDRRRNLELFSSGRDTEWRNRLIWGDRKYVLPSLLPEFAAKIKLIYIDPPFNTDSDFSFTTTIPNHSDAEDHAGIAFIKEPSILEQKAYRDTWAVGSTLICNGSMKRSCCCGNFWPKMAPFTSILTGISVITPRPYLMKSLAEMHVRTRSFGSARLHGVTATHTTTSTT